MNIVAPTLRANGLGGGRYDKHPMVTDPLTTTPYADNVAQHNKLVAHTLTANGYDASEDGTGRGTPLTAAEGVRRLTPVECERLQGFPDGWSIPDETDWREHPRPDGPRYAQMGNAVTVPVAEWIGCRLMAAAGKDGP